MHLSSTDTDHRHRHRPPTPTTDTDTDTDTDRVLHDARGVLARRDLGHATVQVEHTSHRDGCGEDAC